MRRVLILNSSDILILDKPNDLVEYIVYVDVDDRTVAINLEKPEKLTKF
jgi:hypothetical protein